MSDNPFEELARAVLEGASVRLLYGYARDENARPWPLILVALNDWPQGWFYTHTSRLLATAHAQLEWAYAVDLPFDVAWAAEGHALAQRLNDPLIALRVLAGGAP